MTEIVESGGRKEGQRLKMLANCGLYVVFEQKIAEEILKCL
jgi:hypothetical protein